MNKVAKLVIIDPDDRYLLMYRSDHPEFGKDPDLPGGMLESGKTMLETMVREVNEEVGVAIDANTVTEVYSGTDYSASGTHYALFITRLKTRPTLQISWEHSSYEWLNKEDFLSKSKNAVDTYMHMVHDTLQKL